MVICLLGPAPNPLAKNGGKSCHITVRGLSQRLERAKASDPDAAQQR